MPSYKACILVDRHPRASRIGESLLLGAKRLGWTAFATGEVHSVPKADIMAAYGWRNRPTFEAYQKAGLHYIYVDLGYWFRKQYRSDYGGLHKCVLDDRHPTVYFRRDRPDDRLDASAPKVEAWQAEGQHIVVAGMSAKGANSLGLAPLEWERQTIAKIRQLTDRPILYRPKPSDTAHPLPGADFSPATQSIREALTGAHLLVTFYSNAAIDALAAGVPIFSEQGPARVMGTNSLEEAIESPIRQEGRQQFIQDLSYCQFRRSEITDGTMFRQFIDDGMLS